MAEQKLPKLPAFAVFRHVPCKLGEKAAFQFNRLLTRCKPFTRLKRYEDALRKIEALGHGNGPGFGYSCANIAKEALDG